jgi:citrate lyase subunit beta / citryl-CoA lyase
MSTLNTSRIKRHTPLGLRSYLFAPGNHARRVEKVFTVGADAVILDLEDAVAVSEKESTRDHVVAALRKPRDCKAYVRINSFDSRWCFDDLSAVVGPWLDGIVVPKAESGEQLKVIAVRMSDLEKRAGMSAGHCDLMALIETAQGVLQAAEIARGTSRLARLAFGGGDYTNDLNLEWTAEERELDFARATLVHASRVAGLEPPVDTVVIEVKDPARFRLSATHGKRMGFAGKLCIHPDQVAPCNELFSPTPAEVERARAIVAAFEEAEARGSASIQVGGQFVDYPIVFKAQRVLALAERLKSSR